MAINAETFIKVTDPATLQDGDQVVMAYESGAQVSDGFASTKKYIDITDATYIQRYLASLKIPYLIYKRLD